MAQRKNVLLLFFFIHWLFGKLQFLKATEILFEISYFFLNNIW